MTNLAAVVKATRQSAKAIDRIARYGRLVRESGCNVAALKAYHRAVNDYHRAQRILAANPLPGDHPIGDHS